MEAQTQYLQKSSKIAGNHCSIRRKTVEKLTLYLQSLRSVLTKFDPGLRNKQRVCAYDVYLDLNTAWFRLLIN